MTDRREFEAGGEDTPKSFAALRHSGYRYYFIGSALAMMADNIEHVISYWIIFEKFQSPALGGFAVISHWVPFLLFSFYAGALADRFDPRRLIQLGMLLFMAVSLAWGLLFLTDTLEMWHAAVLLTIHGLAGVFWAPAGQMLIHDIVGPKELQSGVRLAATSRTLGILMGPAVGGGLLLAFGPTCGIFINVLIFLPLVIWLWKAPYGPKFRENGQTEPKKGGISGFADILPTIRTISDNRTIVSMILLAGAASLFVGNAHQAQMPEFAHDFRTGGKSSVAYSILLAANAAGALVAGVFLESKSLLQALPRSAFNLVLLWCFAISGFAVSTNLIVAVAMLFIAGFLELSYNAMTQTLVQLNAPAEIRGRVIGLYSMSFLGLKTFSGVTIGLGGSIVGIHGSVVASATGLLLCALALMAYFFKSHRLKLGE